MFKCCGFAGALGARGQRGKSQFSCWSSRVLIAIVALAASAVVGCDVAPTPPPSRFPGEIPRVSAGGAGGSPSGAGGVGGADGTGGAGSGGGGRRFEPTEVYFWGNLNGPGCWGAVAHPDDPITAHTGFECGTAGAKAMIRSDGTLLYLASGYVREFRCDICDWHGTAGFYPENPQDNDPTVSTPSCPGSVSNFLVGPEGDLIYSCAGVTWHSAYRALGVESEIGAPLSLGYNGKLLTDAYVLDIRDGSSIPLVGVTSLFSTYAARAASEDSFWVAMPGETTDFGILAPQRWTVTAEGVATLDGMFPGFVSQFPDNPSFGRFDGDGNVYERRSGLANDFIIRRTLGGTTEIIYDTYNDTFVYIGVGASLFTGP